MCASWQDLKLKCEDCGVEATGLVMVVVKTDSQGRILIPKNIRDKTGLAGEAELVPVRDRIPRRRGMQARGPHALVSG